MVCLFFLFCFSPKVFTKPKKPSRQTTKTKKKTLGKTKQTLGKTKKKQVFKGFRPTLGNGLFVFFVFLVFPNVFLVVFGIFGFLEGFFGFVKTFGDKKQQQKKTFPRVGLKTFKYFVFLGFP